MPARDRSATCPPSRRWGESADYRSDQFSCGTILYMMATGRRAAEAAALPPEDGEVLYDKAVVLALAGDSRKALAALRKAPEQGFSRSVASQGRGPRGAEAEARVS